MYHILSASTYLSTINLSQSASSFYFYSSQSWYDWYSYLLSCTRVHSEVSYIPINLSRSFIRHILICILLFFLTTYTNIALPLFLSLGVYIMDIFPCTFACTCFYPCQIAPSFILYKLNSLYYWYGLLGIMIVLNIS